MGHAVAYGHSRPTPLHEKIRASWPFQKTKRIHDNISIRNDQINSIRFLLHISGDMFTVGKYYVDSVLHTYDIFVYSAFKHIHATYPLVMIPFCPTVPLSRESRKGLHRTSKCLLSGKLPAMHCRFSEVLVRSIDILSSNNHDRKHVNPHNVLTA